MPQSIRVVLLSILSAFILPACFDSGTRSGVANSAGGNAAADGGAVGEGGASSAAAGANTAPRLSGTPPAEVPAGFPYVFRPTSSDAEGDVLRYEIVSKPGWLQFDATTGELRGVPGDADVRLWSGILIVVSDGRGASSVLGPFQIQVNRSVPASGLVTIGLQPPTIRGTPPTSVVAGTGYSFQAVGADPEGDRLTYGALNLPPWLGINSVNGTLTGTPNATQVGTWRNITISVTDGRTTVSLPPFSIEVTAPASTAGGGGSTPATPVTTNGTATLRWVPPTTNADGTPLTNLAGFTVSYGRDATNLSQTVAVENPAATSYTVTGLTSGTWYFAVSSYTSGGLASEVSSVVSKSFP